MTSERGYPDERWYPDDRGGRDGYADAQWDDRQRGYGVPEPHYGEDSWRGVPDARYASLSELNNEMERRRGDRAVLDPPREEFREMPVQAPRVVPPPPPDPVESRSSLRRAAESPTRMTAEPAPDGVYRSKRPGLAIGLGVAVGILELAMLRVFAAGAFGSPLDAGRVVSGALMLIALPLLGLGLYALATGAARAVDMWGPRIWLRPPMAYLTVALIMMVAAGAAA